MLDNNILMGMLGLFLGILVGLCYAFCYIDPKYSDMLDKVVEDVDDKYSKELHAELDKMDRKYKRMLQEIGEVLDVVVVETPTFGYVVLKGATEIKDA